MTNRTLILGALVLLAQSVIPPASLAQNREQAEVWLSEDLVLTSDQQAALGIEALKGSRDAPRRLAAYYLSVRGDREATLRWYTVGAENGDPSCALGLYQLLATSDKGDERIRAMFWLHKAVDGGLKSAKDELEYLNKHGAK